MKQVSLSIIKSKKKKNFLSHSMRFYLFEIPEDYFLHYYYNNTHSDLNLLDKKNSLPHNKILALHGFSKKSNIIFVHRIYRSQPPVPRLITTHKSRSIKMIKDISRKII